MFYEMPLWAIPYALATIALVVCWFWLRPKLAEQRKYKRGRLMIERARVCGSLFCSNSVGEVMAVCTLFEFNKAAKEQEDQPLATVKVPSTFTFSKSSDSSVYTGKHSDIQEIMAQVVKNVTDLGKEDVDKRSYDEAGRLLMAHRKLLYVPFAVVDQYESDRQSYKTIPLRQATNILCAVACLQRD